MPKSPAAAGSPPSPPQQLKEWGGGGDGYDLPAFPLVLLPRDPGTWGVENVYRFISSLPGEGSEGILTHSLIILFIRKFIHSINGDGLEQGYSIMGKIIIIILVNI